MEPKHRIYIHTIQFIYACFAISKTMTFRLDVWISMFHDITTVFGKLEQQQQVFKDHYCLSESGLFTEMMVRFPQTLYFPPKKQTL